MTLFDEPNTEEQDSEEQNHTSYLGVIIFLMTLPVLLFFTYIGKTDLGLNVGICLGMNIFAIGLCWDLRKHFWFWATIVLVLLLHVPLFLMIKWPHVWVSKFSLLPIGIADLLITVGIVRFVEKYIVKYVPPDDEE